MSPEFNFSGGNIIVSPFIVTGMGFSSEGPLSGTNNRTTIIFCFLIKKISFGFGSYYLFSFKPISQIRKKILSWGLACN
ncbi:hypothetical protein K9L27_01830 [Candidatus Gracilibacteria bacterium]|nr:hypothetical protein [Candidatus Gracilibacteria bacterium]